MPTLLLTSFGPFPGCPVNPTDLLAARLAPRIADASGWEVEVRRLPVDWRAVERFVLELAESPRFDGLLSLGVAARRSHICVERFAHNETAGKHDANGIASAKALVPNAPDRLEGRLHRPPFDGAIHAMPGEWPVTYSDDAGRYLCNALFFHMLHRLEAALPGHAPLGFVHVPHVRGTSAPEDDPGAIPLEVAMDALTGLLAGYCRATSSLVT